jgi:hypothetical protein
LPTGRLSATIRRIRGTDEVVILLQQGLTGFLYHFSNVLGCAVPAQWLFDERALPAEDQGPSGDPQRLESAARYVTDLIDAYVVSGDPYLLTEPQLKGDAFMVASTLSSVMRQFVIGHEIMHLVFGDLDEARESALPQSDARNRELVFDDLAAAAVAALREVSSDPPVPLATSMWGCTMALMGFQLLLAWVAFLATGSLEAPESDTHPSPERRRAALLQAQETRLIRSGRPQEAQRLSFLTRGGVGLIQDLWNRTWPHVQRLRNSDVEPSPIWRQRDIPRSGR